VGRGVGERDSGLEKGVTGGRSYFAAWNRAANEEGVCAVEGEAGSELVAGSVVSGRKEMMVDLRHVLFELWRHRDSKVLEAVRIEVSRPDIMKSVVDEPVKRWDYFTIDEMRWLCLNT
jgi:hypothetical protein